MRVLASACLVMLVLVMGAGCRQVPRVNHFHDDHNEEMMDSVSRLFHNATASSDGVTVPVARYLDSHAEFERKVVRDAATADVGRRLRGLESLTWAELIERIESARTLQASKSDLPGRLATARLFYDLGRVQLRLVEVTRDEIDRTGEQFQVMLNRVVDGNEATVAGISVETFKPLSKSLVLHDVMDRIDAAMQGVRGKFLEVGDATPADDSITFKLREVTASVRDPSLMLPVLALLADGDSSFDLDGGSNAESDPADAGVMKLRLAELVNEALAASDDKADGHASLIAAIDQTALALVRETHELRRAVDRYRDITDGLAKLPDELKSESLIHSAVIASSSGDSVLADRLVQSLEGEPDSETHERVVDRISGIVLGPHPSLKRVAEIVRDPHHSWDRIAEYLADLQQARLSLLEETSRHYVGLARLVKSRLKRQNVDADRFERLETLVQTDQPNAAPGTSDPLTLFARADAIADRNANLPADRRHAVIARDARVIGSIRKLASTARNWQVSAPVVNDAGVDGYDHVLESKERLNRAVSILTGYLAVTAGSAQSRDELAIELLGELREHEFHLDEMVSAAAELEIAILAQDLVEFHESGITSADISAAVGITQAAMLGLIESIIGK